MPTHTTLIDLSFHLLFECIEKSCIDKEIHIASCIEMTRNAKDEEMSQWSSGACEERPLLNHL
jgi:hypothetical protein